jgi:hypothetical protein
MKAKDLRAALALIVIGGLAGAAAAAPPPGALPVRSQAVAEELARLDGHAVQVASGGEYRIIDVAGEGAPLVGVVERRGDELWLRTSRGPALRLVGPLAVPRIAGPGYKVWVVGRPAPDGALVVRRLGVLAPPRPAR